MTTDHRFDGPGPDAEFRDALATGRFLIQRCRACGVHRFPPGPVCVACGDAALKTVPASGEGTVHSTTVVRRRPEEGGDHNVALIDLAEGPRLMSRVEGVAPDAVRIGMAVRARIAAGAEPVLVFDVVDEEP